MTANIKAQAGEGQLRLFKIFSNYGKVVDVESGVFDFHYYESILDNTTRVTAYRIGKIEKKAIAAAKKFAKKYVADIFSPYTTP